MTNQHPITPPPELVQQWAKHILTPEEGNLALDLDWFANQAAQWGADQELEACCAEVLYFEGKALAKQIREARRPKPPSLKEQALEALAESALDIQDNSLYRTLRCALEALPND